jgi:hypothetical protein
MNIVLQGHKNWFSWQFMESRLLYFDVYNYRNNKSLFHPQDDPGQDGCQGTFHHKTNAVSKLNLDASDYGFLGFSWALTSLPAILTLQVGWAQRFAPQSVFQEPA